jgi:hypothetical protein
MVIFRDAAIANLDITEDTLQDAKRQSHPSQRHSSFDEDGSRLQRLPKIRPDRHREVNIGQPTND